MIISPVSASTVLSLQHSTPQGLSEREAATRLKEHGPNQIEHRRMSGWRLLLKQFTSPFVYLLIASAVLSIIFHDLIGGWMIVAFILINGILGFYQEYHAEKAVTLLQAILRPSCTVLRGGKEHRVPATDIVPGDICWVELGDIVPADGSCIEAENCQCDESILTGESFPVEKNIDAPLYAGTKVTQGWAKIVISETGHSTSLGRIAKLMNETEEEGAYQRSIRRLSVAILWFVVIAVTSTVVLRLAFPGESTLTWIQFAIFAVALAVSVVPETLPLVVTICLSRGALLMAKKQVVVKRLNSIEDLGSIEVLCVDKTGTLTQNMMRVADVYRTEQDPRLFALRCVEAVRLATPKELDPFNRALVESLSKEESRSVTEHTLQAHLPFDPKRKRVTAISTQNHVTTLISCGAPEEVLKRSPKTDKAFLVWLEQQGKEGRRILTVAARALPSRTTNKSIDQNEHNLTLVGGIAFEDPLKPSARVALKQIQSLGVRVKMLSGDSPDVALAIAKRVGLLKDEKRLMTGTQFLALNASERQKQAQRCTVFARVDPEQKFAIIQELQKRSAVGFLGEGINDAPALKLASVGIAVQEASDIAREAADIILLDKGLDVIAEGICEGRRVFVNIGKYIRATLVSNFGNFFAVIISLFFIPTLPMLPIQILLLNLLSDFPMTAICMDAVDNQEMRSPVRFPVRSILLFCVVLGSVSTAFDFLFFTVYRYLSLPHLQVMWFLASVFTELLLVFSLRSSRWFFQAPKLPTSLLAVTTFAAAASIFVAFVQPFARWFSFPQPTFILLGITIGLAAVYFLITDLVKHWYLHFIQIRAPELSILNATSRK